MERTAVRADGPFEPPPQPGTESADFAIDNFAQSAILSLSALAMSGWLAKVTIALGLASVLAGAAVGDAQQTMIIVFARVRRLLMLSAVGRTRRLP